MCNPFCLFTGDSDFYTLLDIWFPDKKPLPTAFLVDTSEEALLLPDWLKLRMIRSEVSRLVDAGTTFHRAQNPVLRTIHFYLFKLNNMRFFPSALQDLEPQQLLLFVQSFGIPVSSMSKLLQYLDQAVSHDPQTLEQNIMDKRKSAEFEIYCRKLFRIRLILYLISFYRLHGPPGGSTA